MSDTPFATLDRYVAIPRVTGLAASPAGDRAVAVVAELDDDGGAFVGSIWELDLAGGPARRLTRSAKGEAGPVLAADGSLLFTSARPRPGDGDEDLAALWALPPGGGEASLVAERPGGILAAAAAARAGVVAFTAKVAPAGGRAGTGAEEDEAWYEGRRRRRITAVLHEQLPTRHWDHQRGPDEVHVFLGTLSHPAAAGALTGVTDLTPDAGLALLEADPHVLPDGSAVVVAWTVDLPGGRQRGEVVRIDAATGERRVLAGDPTGAWHYADPAVSPFDGRVACLATPTDRPDVPATTEVAILGGDAPRHLDLAPLWPVALAWAADGRLLATGDRAGGRPLVAVDPDTGAATDVAPDGAWSAVSPLGADGSLVALRSWVDAPPAPVLLAAGGDRRPLDAPGRVEVPGRVEALEVTAADGTTVHARLVLPDGADADHRAPLALWIHGGPLGSWNDWSWRWNPWLMAAQGWAVVLADPAFSTGYGPEMVARGWGQWGGNPFTDLMAATDAAEAHEAVDPTRTVAMGGSYGGYMANWVAGHTDRFKAIVSHASLWNLAQFQPTTDAPWAWADEWGTPRDQPEFYRRWSPDTYVDAITTPMLVIHGAFDFRCPISESLRLHTDLVEHGVEAKLLVFPDEHHWVLRPGDAVVWYETVLAFVADHALGAGWARPRLL